MSEIYLQITETPTVVTLSAPVVSGALSSTVTVANTVTVALDSNSLSALENVTVTVGAAITGTVTVSNFPATVTIGSALPAGTNRIGVVTIGAGTVTIGAGTAQIGSVTASLSDGSTVDLAGQLSNIYAVRGVVIAAGNESDIAAPLKMDVNRNLKVVVNAGSVTIGSLPALVAGTAQIGSVTASISNSVTIGSLPKVQIQGFNGGGGGQYLDIGVNESGAIPVTFDVSLPAGTEQIGSVTANTFAVQGTAVTTSNFTSTTASTVLANFNAGREVLTIFNEGAGNLHICAGATCTTIAYQVRLSAGDYYEVPNHQTTITHSAVFATAGTARVVQIS